jgi:hypothetical protein
MNNEQAASPARARARSPRGVLLIATLLTAGALLVGLLGLLVPGATLQEANLPRSLLLFGAFVTGVLAYGLFRMRRWAWAAMLSFVVVNLSFLLPIMSDGAGRLVGAALLLLAGVYMVSVRRRFFGR